MTGIALAIVPMALICLAIYTALRTRLISRRYKPDGELATINGTRLHYHYFPIETAEGCPVLLFVHGASGNAYDQMLAFAGRFEGRYSLLFVDRPGLGFSGRDPEGHASPKAQALLLAGLLSHLNIPNTIAIGHSLGAAVTAALALEAPDRIKGAAFLAPATHPWPSGVNWYYTVASLPVVGPLFCWTLTLPVAERLAPAAITRVFLPDDEPSGYAAAIRLPLLFRPASFRANSLDIARLKPHLIEQSKRYGEIAQPAVVVTGSKDTVVWPSIHSKGLEKDLPNAQLVVIDGAGHMPHLTHTDLVEAEILDLAARVGRTRMAQTEEPVLAS